MFDSESGRNEALPEIVREFLGAGRPPIVFTLGSFAVNAAGQTYDRARTAAAQLDRRALLMVGRRLDAERFTALRAGGPDEQADRPDTRAGLAVAEGGGRSSLSERRAAMV